MHPSNRDTPLLTPRCRVSDCRVRHLHASSRPVGFQSSCDFLFGHFVHMQLEKCPGCEKEFSTGAALLDHLVYGSRRAPHSLQQLLAKRVDNVQGSCQARPDFEERLMNFIRRRFADRADLHILRALAIVLLSDTYRPLTLCRMYE